ncbi:carboxylesterase family protein [uncultured Draconibacterium sp.]|jgi:para-nitrobenzyl esterase|uniref:carboxylesterase/lipase family protein n=1 Tax=uncultured Draconibacterium sp. TaxID=1573823 RepID=UPI003216C3F1
MKNLLVGFLSFLLAISIDVQSASGNTKQTSGPEVKTKSGVVRGVTEGDVSSFKGIPFAAPPVGEFRWRPPQPVEAWEGVRDASEFGPTCAAVGWGAAAGTIQQGSSEDCLYLNVWTPATAKEGAKLPVMVWIHGGGFTGGSGNTNGAGFAKQGVILVSMNYRLGRLGHFAFPALSAERPEEAKGSYAFMDQIAALKWVQENISAFGGDPNNVTIFGFSAGGVSVHSLLTIPTASGLFHKAIGHSSGGRDGVLTGRPMNKENADALYPVSAETIGINFAKMHGIEGTDAEALAKLRALPVVKIVGGGETDGQGGPRIYPGPILDGKFVVETAESAYNAGRQAKVPLMIGNNSAEIGGGFVNSSTTKEELFALFGDLENEAKAAYDPDGTKEFAEVQARFNTDWVWAEPARFSARAFTAIGEPAYIFLFDYVPSYMKERAPYGPGHGTDISFAFDILGEGGGFGPPPTPTAEDQDVARTMNAYWVNFAKTGDPNGEGLPNWPLNKPETNQILEFQRDGKVVGETDPTKARLDVIEKAFKNRARIQTRGGI